MTPHPLRPRTAAIGVLFAAVAILALPACGEDGATSPGPGGGRGFGPTVPARSTGGWMQYRHPTGIGFEYPPDWRLQFQSGMVALVPRDLDLRREMMSYFTLAVPGCRTASAPGVGQYLDAWMRQLNPTTRRTDGPNAAKTRAGQGAVYAYAGRNPATGGAISARVYVIVAGRAQVAFSLVGDERTMKNRGPVMDRIFASFSSGPPQLDPMLLGEWHGESSGRYAISQFTYFFRPDGTVLSGGQGAVSAEFREGGASSYRGDFGTRSVSSGTWCACNGYLIITWSDGSCREEYYVVRGGTLEFRTPSGELRDYMER